MTRKFLKIGPTPGDDFEMLLFVLSQEWSFGHLHLQIARQLAKASSEKPNPLQVAPTFFSFTFRAHLESAYARAARLFDPASGTATVSSIVREAEKKAGKFQNAKASEVRNKIKIWTSRIDAIQPLLVRLHVLRNGLIAHLDADVVLKPHEMTTTIEVTFDEVEQILDTAKEIVKDVLNAYNSSFYADALLSVRDCETLLSIITTSSPASPVPNKST